MKYKLLQIQRSCDGELIWSVAIDCLRTGGSGVRLFFRFFGFSFSFSAELLCEWTEQGMFSHMCRNMTLSKGSWLTHLQFHAE